MKVRVSLVSSWVQRRAMHLKPWKSMEEKGHRILCVESQKPEDRWALSGSWAGPM